MILRVFRENQIFVIILSFLTSIFLWVLSAFVKPYQPDFQTLFHTSLFYIFPQIKELNQNRVICSSINILFLVLNAIYLSRITFKFQLFQRRTLLPYFIFIILAFPYFVSYNGISFALISITIVLRVIHILFNSYEKQSISYGYFNASMLIALASLFHVYTIFLVIFLYFILLNFKGFAWREMVFIIFGLFLPYIVFFSFLYLFNQDIGKYMETIKEMFGMHTILGWTAKLTALAIFSALLLFISLSKLLRDFAKMKIASRKFSIVFFGLLLYSLLLTSIYPIAEVDVLFFLTLPLAFLYSFYFQNCRITLINQLLFLFLLGGNLVYLFT